MNKRALNEKIMLKGLVVGCPMGSPLSDCPLNGLRSVPLNRLNSMVDGLPEETVTNFFKVHTQCFESRLKELKNTRDQRASGQRPAASG